MQPVNGQRNLEENAISNPGKPTSKDIQQKIKKFFMCIFPCIKSVDMQDEISRQEASQQKEAGHKKKEEQQQEASQQQEEKVYFNKSNKKQKQKNAKTICPETIAEKVLDYILEVGRKYEFVEPPDNLIPKSTSFDSLQSMSASQTSCISEKSQLSIPEQAALSILYSPEQVWHENWIRPSYGGRPLGTTLSLWPKHQQLNIIKELCQKAIAQHIARTKVKAGCSGMPLKKKHKKMRKRKMSASVEKVRSLTEDPFFARKRFLREIHLIIMHVR